MFRHIYLKNKPKRFRKPKTRSYFAALGKNVKPLPAKIVQSSDTTQLQLQVPDQYVNLPRFRIDDEKKMNDTPAWTMFTITGNTLMVNENIYMSDEGKQRLKTEFDRNQEISSSKSSALVTKSHSDFYFPNLLFSIPSTDWNNFIAKLPHQDVVNNLNLAEHRHLWPAYQYASAKDSSINQYRSKAIGKYHFLSSIIANLKPGTKVDYAQYFGGFRIDNLQFTVPMDADVNFDNVFEQIDQGKEPAQLLANRFPYLTPSFLNKFSQCPLWHDVHMIGLNLVLPHATNRLGEVNKTQLDGLIGDLPSSKNEPEQFSKMVQDARKMITHKFDKKLSASLFYHARANFGHFDGQLIEIADYIQALSNDLIFPEVIRQLGQLPDTCEVYNEVDDEYYNESHNNLSIVVKNIKPLMGEIFNSISLNQLTKLEQRWHRNVTQIAAHKPLSPFQLKWPALFEQQTINNVTFTCLTNDEQLKQEGNDMHHCVSGYSDRCMTRASHIVSVTTQSGERATLELCIVDKKISIQQNRGVRNIIPSIEIQSATDKLIDALNNKIIAINSDAIKFKRGSLNNTVKTPANNIYPYSFHDNATQEVIYQAYKEAKVLPPCLVADNYQDMLKKNNIVDLIRNADMLTSKDLKRQLI